ncbi:histidine kinase [Burkholderia ubonensis]|uniref:histidine kinase n=1 Tax=Burkholderia ubonensis TaxID=101571 RepID=A0AA40UUR3_9BURK|nr:HAMP domain-containing sensor histidine kinase [Burkholderia ubonensis]KVU32027.1 histidine kinase [Burkholderia ubonensis]KWZ52484.1 histidine kinase [Burkholderia ubonensis]OJB07971.1 histidine kinase [Burkholderia ubonensis]OJB70074.1 histidine kinase [Burkholderia ubonensis]
MTPDPADLLRERAAHYAAQAALFLRDQALSTASHDLRSPLNAMHSWAYVLERQLADADPALQRALAGIRTGIDQQVKLIDDALDAPRAETRTLALAPQPFALRPLLDDVLALARFALADARQVTLDATTPDGAPSLTADRERLAQALWTMLVAAVEASAAGGRVAFSCARDGARLVARVACGVDAAALADPARPHVFETFARREMLRERDAKRVAWVLALAQRVALAHGGTFTHDRFADGAAVTLALDLPCEAPV